MTDQAPALSGRRARGGADARRALRGSTEIKQAGFIRRNMKLYEPFSDDQLELIERNAETVLQETGIDFYEDEEAVEMWKAVGAEATASPTEARRFRVRFPRGLVRSLIKTAPREMCSMRAIQQIMLRLVATTPCLRRSMARPLFAIWMKVGAMRLSKTSAISLSWFICCHRFTMLAARCVSLLMWLCRSGIWI